MNVSDYLEVVGYKSTMEIMGSPSEVWKSKYDDSYMTHVGMEENVQFLADREITEYLTHGVGFSPAHGKWYGWSHRAIYGFEVGSTCNKGDCHYVASTNEDNEQAAIAFWEGENHLNTRCEGVVKKDGEKYFDIKWEYDDKVPNEKLRGTSGGNLHHMKPLGRGKWTAKTMEDAKQMAQDFNEGVS